MKLLEERIVADGEVKADGVLKVGSFLNHQLDTALLDEMGAEWAPRRRMRRSQRTRSRRYRGAAQAIVVAHDAF